MGGSWEELQERLSASFVVERNITVSPDHRHRRREDFEPEDCRASKLWPSTATCYTLPQPTNTLAHPKIQGSLDSSHHTSIYCETMFSEARNPVVNGGTFIVHNHDSTTTGARRIKERYITNLISVP